MCFRNFDKHRPLFMAGGWDRLDTDLPPRESVSFIPRRALVSRKLISKSFISRHPVTSGLLLPPAPPREAPSRPVQPADAIEVQFPIHVLMPIHGLMEFVVCHARALI